MTDDRDIAIRMQAAVDEATRELAQLSAAFMEFGRLLAVTERPTRWQRFCWWMQDFWLTPRW